MQDHPNSAHAMHEENQLRQSPCTRFGLSVDPYAEFFPSARSHLNHMNSEFSSQPLSQLHESNIGCFAPRPTRPSFF